MTAIEGNGIHRLGVDKLDTPRLDVELAHRERPLRGSLASMQMRLFDNREIRQGSRRVALTEAVRGGSLVEEDAIEFGELDNRIAVWLQPWLMPFTTLPACGFANESCENYRMDGLEVVMVHEEVAASFAELGNSHRLSVFRFLVKAGHDGASVGEIQKRLGIPASTLSHHLARMAKVGLILQEKHRRTIVCIPSTNTWRT